MVWDETPPPPPGDPPEEAEPPAEEAEVPGEEEAPVEPGERRKVRVRKRRSGSRGRGASGHGGKDRAASRARAERPRTSPAIASPPSRLPVPVVVPEGALGGERRSSRRRTARGRRRRRRRIVVRTLLVSLGLAAALTALAIPSALAARRALEQGRTALTEAQTLLGKGEAGPAGEAFGRARTAFGHASSEARRAPLRVLGLLPLAGRTPDALRALSDVGGQIAAAGEGVTAAVGDLPEGLASLAPKGHVIPIRTIQALEPAVSLALRRLEAADRTARGIAGSFVLGPVASARDLVREKLDGAVRLARSADAMLAALPDFAGLNGPRRYFVGLQNPAELRGTGGIIGEYTILTLDHGRIDLPGFRPLQELPDLPRSEAPPLPPDMESAYGHFGGGGFWINLNASPGLPEVAPLIEDLWRRTQAEALSGVLLVTPQALPPLMAGVGAVTLPGGHRITAQNAVSFIANRAYFVYRDQATRKEILGIAAHEVLDRVFAGRSAMQSVRALITAGSQGYLQMHSTDPRVETSLRLAGVAGAFGPEPGSDFFGLVVNNVGGDKLDYYIRQSVRYDVTLLPGGAARAAVEMEFRNTAPAGQARNEALGPFQKLRLGLVPGESYRSVAVYCGPRCTLDEAREDGSPVAMLQPAQRGPQVATRTMVIQPQGDRTLSARMTSALAWTGGVTGGTYRLTLQGQPAIQPTEVMLTIHAPPGMQMSSASPGASSQGATATWRGTIPTSGSTVDFRFAKPFIPRVFTQIKDLLRRPVVRL